MQLEQADAEVKRLNQCLEISRAECEKLLRGPNEEKELSKGNATVRLESRQQVASNETKMQ